MAEDRWSDTEAAAAVARWAHVPEPVALRTYTARLIGSDPSLVLHGGGNTSVKAPARDALGRDIDALYVKGSGWDLATIEPEGHVAVELAPMRALASLDTLSDDAMVNAQRRARFDSTAPNPSIETLLHAFLPHRFIDHSHADAIVALTNRPDGEQVVRQAFGEAVAVVPYVMAGFDLALAALAAYRAHPDCHGLVLLHHGLFTFGDDAATSYRRHIAAVRRAEQVLYDAASRQTFSLALTTPSTANARRAAGRALPTLRGELTRRSGGKRKVLRWRADPDLLEILSDDRLAMWAATGPLTPDHVIRTKPRPMLLGADPHSSTLSDDLADAVEAFVHDYEEYVAACARGPYVRLDPTPSVIWWPGVGIVAAGRTATEADKAADIAVHTLRTKRLGHAIGPMQGLADAHLFAMEYWPLEQRKLARAEPELARRVALITGGAGAIGVGVARQLLDRGAHVVLTDVDAERLAVAAAALDDPRVATVAHDVTQRGSTEAAFRAAARAFGGVDLVVVNAGIARGGAVHELDDDDWAASVAVNLTGTRHTLAAAADHLLQQGTGGDIVVVSTKNVAAPGAAFGAYSATKAGAHQLARVAALELAPHDIRVNLVAPDAVFEGEGVRSALWQHVGPSRARAKGIALEELPEHYRQRNLLQVSVLAADVGRAVCFFAARHTPTTGAVLPVDGGLPGAFPR